mgnify:CR=1 FL=1
MQRITFYLLLVLTALCASLRAQSLVILDKANRQPVVYAHLVYLNQGKQVGGLYTNTAGKATLSDVSDADSIRISCLGYTTKVLPLQKVRDTVYLAPEAYALAEVKLYPKGEQKTLYLGISREERSQPYTTYSGFKWVVHVTNSAKENKLIKQFYFEITERQSEGDYRAKVIFYQNDNGKPGKPINYEKQIVVNSSTEREVLVDVSDGYLTLPPNGLFVGLEWEGCLSEKKFNAKCKLTVRSVGISEGEDCLKRAYIMQPYKDNRFFDSNQEKTGGYCRVPVFGLMVYE